jgi:hypothetical protein
VRLQPLGHPSGKGHRPYHGRAGIYNPTGKRLTTRLATRAGRHDPIELGTLRRLSRYFCGVERALQEEVMGRGLLLWLIGIPLPIILLIWVLGGLHG